DVDRFPTPVLFTPALTRTALAERSVQGTWYGLQLRHGSRDAPAVEQALIKLIPSGSVYTFRVTALNEAKVQRSVRPEAIALGVFGAIAALAGLAIASLAISRLLRACEDDASVLRAIG